MKGATTMAIADLAVNRPNNIFPFYPAMLVVGTGLGCSAMTLGYSSEML